MGYYDGTKLLSMLDLDGNKPELYIASTNRSAGKTTFYSRYLVKKWLKNKEKFLLLYRYSYELENCEKQFFSEVQKLFFIDKEMTSHKKQKGKYVELIINDVQCGYATAINCAESVKKLSHLFADVSRIFFDEFQSETNTYCPNEIEKFISIHNSIARGGGKQSRYVPVIMCGNRVSLLNPYYSSIGVSERIQSGTKFLKGNGWVLETSTNADASKAVSENLFNKAFIGNQYITFASENAYLNDDTAFVQKMDGHNDYLCTVFCDDKIYSIRNYGTCIYCDDNPDITYPVRVSVSYTDIQKNYLSQLNNKSFIDLMRKYFENGLFRFKNLECKNCIIKLLAYR